LGSDEIHDDARRGNIDNHPDKADEQKLGKLLALLVFLFVPKSPIFVEKIAECHSDEE
jgi:hypothetical protein